VRQRMSVDDTHRRRRASNSARSASVANTSVSTLSLSSGK
jgi:hypothetical protein